MWAQEVTEVPEMPSTGVLSEISRRHFADRVAIVLEALQELRANQGFWLSLGPAFRVRYEDFQGDLAALRQAFRR